MVWAPRIGKMWRWKRKAPGAAAGDVGAETWEEEAVAPEADWAKTRKA
jgi:hypothetical protein